MTTGIDIVNIAAKEIGTKEVPANSNTVKYNTWYYGSKVSGSWYPWCCAFVNWVFYKANAMKLFNGGTKSAYCPTVVNWAKKNNLWLGRTTSPKAGDLVFYARYNDVACHIGIVEKKLSNSSVQTIEGNTSSGAGGSQDNGGIVARRTRNYGTVGSSWYILGFARPRYTGTSTTTTTTQKTIVEKNVTDYKATVTADSLNIRKGPDTTYEIVGTYAKNATITITATNTKGTWGKTSKGWVCLDWVKKVTSTTTQTTTSSSSFKAYNVKVTTKAGLNLRAKASTSSTKLTTIPYNTKLKITKISKNEKWGKVNYNGKVGWIYLKYTSKV